MERECINTEKLLKILTMSIRKDMPAKIILVKKIAV